MNSRVFFFFFFFCRIWGNCHSRDKFKLENAEVIIKLIDRNNRVTRSIEGQILYRNIQDVSILQIRFISLTLISSCQMDNIKNIGFCKNHHKKQKKNVYICLTRPVFSVCSRWQRNVSNGGPSGRKEGRRSWQPGIYNSDYGVYGDNLVNSVAFIFP